MSKKKTGDETLSNPNAQALVFTPEEIAFLNQLINSPSITVNIPHVKLAASVQAKIAAAVESFIHQVPPQVPPT